jgi:hypothetical protein
MTATADRPILFALALRRVQQLQKLDHNGFPRANVYG